MKNKVKLELENLYDDGEYIWFTPYNLNCLCRMEKTTWKTTPVAAIPKNKMQVGKNYRKIIDYENTMFFTPFYTDELVSFSKINGEIHRYDIGCFGIDFIKGCHTWNYASMERYQNQIYLFPHERTAVLCFDLNKKCFRKEDRWTSQIFNECKLSAPRLYYNTLMIDGKIYAPIMGTNAIQVIDLGNDRSTIFHIGEIGNTWSDIAYDGHNFIIAPLEGRNIVIWDGVSENYDSYPLSESKLGRYQFISAEYVGNMIYLLPYMYRGIVAYDVDSGKISDAQIDIGQYGKINVGQAYYNGSMVSENKLYLFDSINNKLNCIDIETKKAKTENIEIDISEYIDIVLKSNIDWNYLMENETLNLNFFLKILQGWRNNNE